MGSNNKIARAFSVLKERGVSDAKYNNKTRHHKERNIEWPFEISKASFRINKVSSKHTYDVAYVFDMWSDDDGFEIGVDRHRGKYDDTD